jgi:hypothetical protein
MLWEIRYRLSGCVTLTVACGSFEIELILEALEHSTKTPMEAILVRNDGNRIDNSKRVVTLRTIKEQKLL